jgi:hypothetical protein
MSGRPANANLSTVAPFAQSAEPRRGRREKAEHRKAPQPVVVRMPAEMLAQLDEAVSRRSVRVPRHTWILEAIAEKLAKEAPEIPSAVKGRRHGT